MVLLDFEYLAFFYIVKHQELGKSKLAIDARNESMRHHVVYFCRKGQRLSHIVLLCRTVFKA